MTVGSSSSPTGILDEETFATQVSVSEFYRRIEQPNTIVLLDVRNQDEFEAWRIESRYTPETLHLSYIEFLEDEREATRRVPRDRELVVVCAKGGASDFVAAILRQYGIRAVNLAGGMLDWGGYYVFRPVVEHEAYQIYQVDRIARGCLSYVLVSQGQAAIIDPLRHTAQYRGFLAAHGATLTVLLDTHAHADHISGGPELSSLTAAPYYLHPYDAIHPFDMLPARIAYEMLRDEQTFTLGDLTVRTIHAPGHTLGQVNLLATGPDGERYFFSGDNLFLQSFGRPDLGGQADAWLPLVYETIFATVRAKVPEDAWVLPGHYARFEEANPAGLYVKRLGDLWHENEVQRLSGRDEFIEHVLTHLPTLPPQYVQIKRVNIGLAFPNEDEANELELGKNVCALAAD